MSKALQYHLFKGVKATAIPLALVCSSCGATDASEPKQNPKVNQHSEAIEAESAGESNLEAEAKLKPIVDAVQNNFFYLDQSCASESSITLMNNTLELAKTQCKVEGVQVYLGSAELELRVSNCKTGNDAHQNTYYVFGSSSKNNYYIVSNDEVKSPIFICQSNYNN